MISKIKDWLTFAGGIYQRLLLVCNLSLLLLAHLIHWWLFIVWFLGFQQWDQKLWCFNCSAGTFTSTVISALWLCPASSLFFLQQSQRAENTLFKQCNMAAMLLLWFFSCFCCTQRWKREKYGIRGNFWFNSPKERESRWRPCSSRFEGWRFIRSKRTLHSLLASRTI